MKKFVIAALALVLISATAAAQNNGGGRRQRMNTAEMNNRMAERLADQMKLDSEKANLFKVLYLDYQNARQNAANPKGEEEEERVNMKKLTDEKATELIDKQLKGQEAQLTVDKEYLPKFLEILTPSQAAYIYLRGAGMRSGNNGRQGNGGDRPGGFGGGGFPGGGFPGGGFGGGGFGGPMD